MPATTSARSKRGPIIISRHGRPALDRRAGPRLAWRDYVQWWDNYEAGPLADGQQPPQALMEVVADAEVVFASGRLRAQQTAAQALPHKPAAHDPVFNEATLPPPTLGGVKALPKTWNVLARTAWLGGHSLGGETSKEARLRAKIAALRLHEASAQGKVYLAAHGWFNRMLRPELRQLGWICVEDGGDRYWSYRVYVYRGR
ncbi:MAG: histidine phosphatase family protein [Hyphomonas sp.]|uniref:histidine phosphatase family protein n=1 Tax=Hyphomonas sp. TaxID=87 RepID=UPI0017DF13F5|nr:histidine phosphatase family protein [Hyphomonas sp.]MBA3069746.1 histidine phosphatase family protein [Hyphomonas sp.]MBU4062587.1 histidine phosphatase family protein [Alphaproteobacteria bacterium]MBU4163938.1 histidine phosphatase family protein [Alphaproteobacteria bacterium]